MSGIAGIFNLDGQPVDRDLLERMTTAIAHRGPDGTGYWVDGAVGFGHQMLCTTPESLHERQPLRDATGQLCLVMDGRVDNCAELRAALLARGTRPRDDTDAELVLCAYQVWGEACPKQIIGDFAFVIWDARKRQLFCARDFLGIKPFYYHFDGRTFRFASELHQILEDPAISREPNEGMVAEYLTSFITNREETLYSGVSRLTPAHFLVIRFGHIHKGHYWQFEPIHQLRYKNDSEYAEHFLYIFKEAIKCRLRCNSSVGAYLSGGLDSSSIVGVCQSLLRKGEVHLPGFETFSLVFPGRPECDESEYIRDVVDLWGLKANILRVKEPKSFLYRDQAKFYLDFPDYPNGTSLDSIMETASGHGIRVMLTGYGGDDRFTGNEYYYADMLYGLRVKELLHELKNSLRVLGIRSTTELFFAYGLRPLFPQGLRRVVRDNLLAHRTPAWLDTNFAQRTAVLNRVTQEPINRLFNSYTQREMYRSLVNGSLVHGREMQDRSASRWSLEERHPFTDRHVIDFALALPEYQRCRNFQTKIVLRKAMQDIIPESIRHRSTKAEFSHLFPSTFDILGGKRIFENLCIAKIGWISNTEVIKMYESMEKGFMQNDEMYILYTWKLWMIYGIEQWFLENFSHNTHTVNIPDILQDATQCAT